MGFVEITGRPCSGKSTHVDQQILNKKAVLLNQGILVKLIYVILGINFLGFKRLKTLYDWSLIEDAPLYFKINIFLNALSKFGSFKYLKKINSSKTPDLIIDEGISHIPFLFLKTDTSVVIDFITRELKSLNVAYLSSLKDEVMYNRLLNRGHKRLKFLSLNSFIESTIKIENNLLTKYPTLCKKFKIIDNVRDL